MRLPNGESAVVDPAKLEAYCLDTSHPRGKHKARVFVAALGITAAHAEELRAALLKAAAQGEARPCHADEFGQRYLIDLEVDGPTGRGVVRSAWIIRRGESVPRLTSCYVK